MSPRANVLAPPEYTFPQKRAQQGALILQRSGVSRTFQVCVCVRVCERACVIASVGDRWIFWPLARVGKRQKKMFGSLGRKANRPPDENTTGRAQRGPANNNSSPFGGMLANRGGLLTGKVCVSNPACVMR